MEIKREQLVAMAVCALSEDFGTKPEKIHVLSFKECPKSSLQDFIEKNNIEYRKYILGDEAI